MISVIGLLVGLFAFVAVAAEAPPEPLPDSVTRAARKLFLENAVCAADLERRLADARKGRTGRLDGTTLFHRRKAQAAAEARFDQAQKALAGEFATSLDLERCGTGVQAARVLSRKPIPSPDSPDQAREWAGLMPEPTVAALLCLRRRVPANEARASDFSAVTEAVLRVYRTRFGREFSTVAEERCGAGK